MIKKPFLFASKQLFLIPLLFAVIYAVIFFVRKEATMQEFNMLMNEVPSLVRFGSSAISVVTEYFPKFGALGGVVFALVQMIVAAVIFLIMKIVRLSKWKLTVPLALFLALLPLAFLGHNMVFVSNRFTALSSGIILFVGYPLWYASLALGTLLILILLYGLLKKVKADKLAMVGLMVGASMTLSGCDLLGWFIGFSCDFSSDDVHCYQEVAVNSGEADECEKVPQKEGYTTSNPPQDKCHLMIAENTGDPTACDDMKGGVGSYTREECLENVFANGSPDDCEGRPNEQECRDMYAENSGVDPECADPTFTAQCKSSNSLLVCEGGKSQTERCEFGCFEAACRSEVGETDIAPPEPEEEDEPLVSDDSEEGDELVEPDDEVEADAGDEEDDEDDDKKDEPEAECEIDGDCQQGFECKDKICVLKPECNKKDFFCLSTSTLQICTDDQKVDYEDCAYGCEDKHCLSKEEKDEKDEKEEEKDECKDGTNKCLTDVTLEMCVAGKKTTEKCEFGCDKSACRTEPKKKCTGLQRLNPFCSEDDDDIEDKEETDISTIKDAVKGHYMDALQAAIDGETDPAKVRGLEAYQAFLNKAGEQMENAQTTIDDLNAIKRIFLDSYDPSMDVENMDVSKILKPGIFDRIGTAIFGGPKTPAGIEMAEASDGLAVYEQMLNRQGEIDFLKQSRMERLGQVVTDKVKGEMVDELKDKATDIAGAIAGDAMLAVAPVDYALTAFQDEAKHQLFVGLARAYNRRRAALQAENPDMSEEDIHKKAVAEVKQDPYQDAKGRSFMKYGNILENADCQKGTGNQLCIDHRVFWTAMDKTYQHTHEKELRKRYHDQLDRDFKKHGY